MLKYIAESKSGVLHLRQEVTRMCGWPGQLVGSMVWTRNSRLYPGRQSCLCWHWASHPMFSLVTVWFLKLFFPCFLDDPWVPQKPVAACGDSAYASRGTQSTCWMVGDTRAPLGPKTVGKGNSYHISSCWNITSLFVWLRRWAVWNKECIFMEIFVTGNLIFVLTWYETWKYRKSPRK